VRWLKRGEKTAAKAPKQKKTLSRSREEQNQNEVEQNKKANHCQYWSNSKSRQKKAPIKIQL